MAAKRGDDSYIEAEKKKTKAKNLRTVLLCVLGVIGGAVALCVAAVFILTRAVTAEVGETPDLSRLDGLVGSLICTEHDAAESIDTSSVAERKAECIFFGFVRKNLKVSVVDTTPPTLETADLTIGVGDSLDVGDFIVKAEDLTGIETYYTDAEPTIDKAGEYTVAISAKDEGDNVTESEAKLTVEDERTVIDVEFGTDAEKAAEMCSEKTGLTVGADQLDVGKCGDYRIMINDGDGRKIISVSVKDTTPPTATAFSFDVVVGESIAVEDILTDVHDESEVKVDLVGEPDFSTAGEYNAYIDLTDEWGNSARYETAIRVHDITTDVTAEAGSTVAEIKKLFFPHGEDDALKVSEDIEKYRSKIGEYELTAVGEYSEIPLKLTVEDTVAPTLAVKDKVVFVGQTVTPEMLVTSCKDATEVKLSFADEPRMDKPNDIPVTIIAEDEAGNRTEAKAKLFVNVDDQPPVIYGVSTVYVNKGENVTFGAGVYAVDNADGTTEVTIDSSAVDTSKEGTYYVKYKSEDKAGNVGETKGAVVVNSITMATVNELADGILSQITNASMTPRDKAWAIYSWCTSNIKYSTRTSYLMGRFVDGAYSGFKTRMGNCYIYYAVSSALLSRAGIENIEIHRNSTSNPHYWNLIKIGGAWYHFDTCPHYAQYPLTSFMLTDAEMRNYSETQSIGYYDFDASLYPATP